MYIKNRSLEKEIRVLTCEKTSPMPKPTFELASYHNFGDFDDINQARFINKAFIGDSSIILLNC